MLQVALWQPEIPPNTGNVARLCAATGTPLHIIGQPAFSLDDRTLRRAGLDYWPHVELIRHRNFADFEAVFKPEQLIFIETTDQRLYTQANFVENACLIFGSESAGLPASVLTRHADRIFGIPMKNVQVRSLNLATSVGIVLYEGLRQQNNW